MCSSAQWKSVSIDANWLLCAYQDKLRKGKSSSGNYRLQQVQMTGLLRFQNNLAS